MGKRSLPKPENLGSNRPISIIINNIDFPSTVEKTKISKKSPGAEVINNL